VPRLVVALQMTRGHCSAQGYYWRQGQDVGRFVGVAKPLEPGQAPMCDGMHHVCGPRTRVICGFWGDRGERIGGEGRSGGEARLTRHGLLLVRSRMDNIR
jgi:hypothetical protein